MSRYYYFYKEVTEDNNWPKWKPFDEGGYCGIPYIGDYGGERLKPQCKGCKHEGNEDYWDRSCFECRDDHRTYRITRSQAERIQEDMECNKTLFTDLMDRANQDYIYIRYD